MKYQKRKGLSLSELTLGTVQLGLDYSINGQHPNRAQSLAILKCATEQGINVLDTARDYGDSEAVIGSFLSHNPDPLVVSKFKLDPGGFRNPETAWGSALKSVKQSLEILGLSKLPILLFHKTPQHDLDATRKTIPGILDKLKELDLIKIGGVSVVSADEIKHFKDCDEIEAFQVPVNLFDHRLLQSGMLEEIHAAGKIVFARSIFLKGLFFKQPEELNGRLEEAIPYLRSLQGIAANWGLSIAELAFGFVQGIPEITSMVFGADNAHQVRQNIHLLDRSALPLALRAEIVDVFKNVPEKIITPHLWAF